MRATLHSRATIWIGASVAFSILSIAGCGEANVEDEAKHDSVAVSPFAHLTRPSLGSVSIARAKNTTDFIRRFPQAGEIFLVGVPIDRLIGEAYGKHPKDIVFKGARPKGSYYDVIVRAKDRRLETAQEMLREAVRDKLQIETHVESRESMTLVLTRLPGEPVLHPSDKFRHTLELRAGRLQAIGSPLTQLIQRIRDGTKYPVVDNTNLLDRYDYVLEWDPKAGAYAFLQALEDLGLNLILETRTVEVLVVKLAKNAKQDD